MANRFGAESKRVKGVPNPKKRVVTLSGPQGTVHTNVVRTLYNFVVREVTPHTRVKVRVSRGK